MEQSAFFLLLFFFSCSSTFFFLLGEARGMGYILEFLGLMDYITLGGNLGICFTDFLVVESPLYPCFFFFFFSFLALLRPCGCFRDRCLYLRMAAASKILFLNSLLDISAHLDREGE